MRDSWRVFTRDAKRIVSVPRSLIIIFGILVTPALYTWLNILAFWNPYNATENLPIAVVNNDVGASSALTGQLNVGDLVVEQLSANEQLGWQFTDQDTANHKIRAGEVYAAFVIPETFSKDLVDIFSGQRHQPTIEYYVNEKKGAIAPKITDVGANELDIQITSTFRGQVGEAIAQALRDGGLEIDANIVGAEGSALDALGGINRDLADAQVALDSASESLTGSLQTMEKVRAALAAADPALADVSAALSDAQDILGTVVSDASEFAAMAGQASINAQKALNESSAAAGSAVSNASNKLTEMDSQLQSGIQRANDSIAKMRDQIAVLEGFPETQKLSAELKTKLNDMQNLLAEVGKTGSDAAQASEDLNALMKAFDQALTDTQRAATDLREQSNQTASTLNARVTQLSAQLGAIKSAVSAARISLTEISALTHGVDDQIVDTQDVLGQVQSNLNALSGTARGAQTDVATLATGLRTGTLKTVIGLDPTNIGRYLTSPVKFDQQTLFPINSYGSGMAAMFINLSLWIGALILVIIFRVEVDKEGFDWLSLRSAYLGRFMLSGVLSIGQGLIVSVGSLLLGVQAVNAPAFIATAMLIGPCYLAIIYALAAALSHVGRALAILLVVLQIPGASGIYPIELMPRFFRQLSPMLPFSYGIDAMRETIGGFYGGRFWHVIAVLLIMSVTVFLLGFWGRRRLGYFTQLFYDDLARTELVVNEDVQLQSRGYRLSNIIALLGNRKEFSTRIRRRQEEFNARYPALINGLSSVGILGLVVLGMISRLTSASKPALLGILAIWGLVIIGTLVGVVVLKSSIERAERLSHLTEDELFESLARQREVNANKTTNRSASRSSRSKRRLITAPVRADATDQTTDKPADETDTSATCEETR
uniref:YhgE/Pip domain-containing protein n=1 Tax=Vaginimicrobium propionicum TaxID=1871034 RepID=UPI0009708241|nr:YhgE/Pip domain-containing protein [Vaginimicrobium propionicum]